MMFWLVVTGMVAVGIVDDYLIRRSVTHEEKLNESAERLVRESGIALPGGKLSGFDESKERILRALQTHYYFADSGESVRDYGDREVAKIGVEPKVA
jgi:hypothetical protein